MRQVEQMMFDVFNWFTRTNCVFPGDYILECVCRHAGSTYRFVVTIVSGSCLVVDASCFVTVSVPLANAMDATQQGLTPRVSS